MQKNKKINIAIQVLPQAEGKKQYDLVDIAIETIKNSGYRYHVCPFETVVECNFNEIQGLIEKIHIACAKAGTQQMITNLKIQVDFKKDVTIDDKMEKYW